MKDFDVHQGNLYHLPTVSFRETLQHALKEYTIALPSEGPDIVNRVAYILDVDRKILSSCGRCAEQVITRTRQKLSTLRFP